jgi:hypothetical protein
MQEMDMSDHFLKSGLCQWIIDFTELQIGKQVRTASFSAYPYLLPITSHADPTHHAHTRWALDRTGLCTGLRGEAPMWRSSDS